MIVSVDLKVRTSDRRSRRSGREELTIKHGVHVGGDLSPKRGRGGDRSNAEGRHRS
jgi:hypothetical protein